MSITKRLSLGVLCSLVVCLSCTVSCVHKTAEEKAQAAMAKKGGMVVTLAAGQPELTDSVKILLNARLAQSGVKDTYVSLSDEGLIEAQIPGVSDVIDAEEAELVRQLLQAPGELEIWETYTLAELFPMLTELNSTDSIFNIIAPYVSDEGVPARGPIVGMVPLADKDAAMALLSSPAAQAVLPADVLFRWSKAVVNYEYGELIALKARDGKPAFTGECLSEIESQQTKDCPYPNISIVMDDADTWERFTGENIDRSIAFVVDDVVYSFPTVVSAIPGGKSQISGSMTYEEAAAAAAIMKYPLPCEVKIVGENRVNTK